MRTLSTSPQPLIRGALRQTPLAEFLVQAYDAGLEGTLLLQTPEREKSAILFVRGAPAKARPAVNEVFLGKVAAELGLIETSVAVSTRKKAEASGKPHGQILREEGLLDETGLYVALREQLTRQVLRLCDLPETTGFGFYRANYLADWGPSGQWRVKPLPMVWRALVDHLPESRRSAWLQRLGETPLKMRPEAPVSRYGLTPQEKAVLDMLRAKSTTVEALSNSGVGSPELVRRIACALLLSRQIQVGSDKDPVGLHEPPESPASVPPPETRAARRGVTFSKPPSVPVDLSSDTSHPGGASPGSLPPRSVSVVGTSPASRRGVTTSMRPRVPSLGPHAAPASEAMREEIEQYQSRQPQNHYEVLGVERKADTATIRTAFFQLARTWHPDRLPADLADLKPIVTKAFAAMGDAHHTLSDDQRRAEYDHALQDAPDDEQAQVAAILDAANAYQRAEVYMKKKDYKAALEHAQIAYEGDPSQADHMALYAWAQSLNGAKNLEELIGMLNKALAENADNVRALWYRAQLLKKSGKNLMAMKDFKHIVQLKPSHTEAKRELRIFKMRKQSGGGTQTSGFFGVFKKKD